MPLSITAPVKAKEAAANLSARDVGYRLSKAVADAHSDSSGFAYYKDHIGDDDSGDVVYYHNGDDKIAPYDFDGEGSTPVIHTVDAKKVMSRTAYEPVPDDDSESYTSQLEESFKTAKLYTSLPLYERFISQGERDKADSGDFAGKGKSFPILKADDVMAAVRSIGRAGSDNFPGPTLKKNIIRIAKKKGFGSRLPKSWQNGGSKEAAVPRGTGVGDGVGTRVETGVNRLTLIESAAVLETIVLREAKADYEIKLIAPGKGSTAFYPAEVLRRDGPKVFKAGTHVYLNHPTAAEEAARPEGDVSNLAGVLTKDSVYHESHPKGPGLFSYMKVFADHAQMVEEKAPHVGMSIRAFGQAESGKAKDGVPVLKELTSAESVDVVTKAGAGGMILTEAARPNPEEVSDMDAAEMKALQESNRKLLERALRADAREEAQRLLEGVSLPAASKMRIVETVMRGEIPQKDGGIDTAKFTETVNTAAKEEGRYVAQLTGSGRVVGMGQGGGELDPVKAREAQTLREAEEKRLNESAEKVFADLMGSKEAGKYAASKGEAA